MGIPLTSLIIAGLGAAVLALLVTTIKLARSYRALRSRKRSGEVRRGLMTEQWLPFVDPYPWDPQNFRFIGSPIDGVQFEDDRVIFVEFKSGSSQLSAKQTRIRELVRAGKVDFREVRLKISRGAFQELQVH